MQFSLSSDAALTGVWFYSATGAGRLPTRAGIFRVSDHSLVTSQVASWSGAAGSGWVKTTFDGSVTLTAGVAYKVVVSAPNDTTSWYAITQNYFSTGAGGSGITSGIITAPNNASAETNQHAYSSTGTGTLVYPVSGFNASNFWMDVEVTTGSALTSVTATRATTWNVVASVTQTKATTWNVVASVTQTKATTWNVATSLTQVTATRATSWAVVGRATGTRATTWAVVGRATATRTTTWNTLAFTVNTTAIANVVQGVQVRRWLQASGGVAPYTWAVTVGTLPAGLSLASDGTLSGTPTGTGTSSFTVQATDAGSDTATRSLSITSVSAPFSPGTPSTDANGVVTWNITSSINLNTAQTIRVLEPTAPSSSYPHALVIVLPVWVDNTYGNGLDNIRVLGLHNSLNLTAIEPSTGGYWLADNPSNANLLQETYLLQVVAWAKSTYGTTGSKNVYLIGFSKSGIAGQGLFLHHPDVYTKVASWDLPAMMTGYDGTDPAFGTVGGDPASSYGTQDNFTANYQLSATNLAKWASGRNLGAVNRIWLGGYNTFQNDVSQYDSVLTTAGIAHTYASVSATPHNWSTTPQWVTPALTALADVVTLLADTGTGADALSTTATAPLADPRSVVDALTISAAVALAQTVVGTDNLTIQIVGANDGVPVKSPGTVLTIPVPGVSLTVPATATALTVPAARTELT
jgi:hypothetical protein